MTRRVRVDAFELHVDRRLLRVSWVERETNKWVLDKIGFVFLAERKMRFFGHIVRKKNHHDQNDCYMKRRCKRADLQIPRSRIGKTVHGGCVPISN